MNMPAWTTEGHGKEAMQHCRIVNKTDHFRISFLKENTIVLAIEVTPFQFWLMCSAIAAGAGE